MHDESEIIKAIGTTAWPAVAAYAIWAFREQVAELIDSAKVRKFTIEIGGQKLSMEEANQQQQLLIGDLQKRLNDLSKKIEGPEASHGTPAAMQETVRDSKSKTSAVLWVDDNPKNNSYFIELLQQRGYRVDLAESTGDALARIEGHRYRLILSDMGRKEVGRFNADAGIDLLEELNKKKSQVPYVVFCSGDGVRRFGENFKGIGGYAITSSATDLRAILDDLTPGE